MLPTRPPASRYLRAARRAYAARVLAAGALVALPAACSSGDADVFESSSADTPTETSVATSEPAVVESTSSTEVVATSEVPTSTEPAVDDDDATVTAGFPAGAELVVDFTFQPSSSGRVNNPYVAVWVEDAQGELVQTISLWFEQGSKGTRWLRDLRAWTSASGGAVDTTSSGATRSAGSYTVVWDGTDLDGNLIPAGEYVLYVEAAREHGPYEITSAAFAADGGTFSLTLADDGELSNLSAILQA